MIVGAECEVRSRVGVNAPGREVDVPTYLSPLSTVLVDYSHLRTWCASCQPSQEESSSEPR